MRSLCDYCECAAAVLFCTADQAALCSQCDEKVHACNKFASRHTRVQLAETSVVGSCDICESSPAFFFCAMDGTSLCLECDLFVHVGGKQLHDRYLVLRQKVEFSADKSGNFEGLVLHHNDNDEKLENYGLKYKKRLLHHMREKIDCCRVPNIPLSQVDINHHDFTALDLNARPHRIPDQVASSNQTIQLA